MDDASLLGSAIKIDVGLPSSLLGPIGIGFQWGKMYLCSITLINTYSVIYLTIGGQEGVDAGGANWMTIPIWEVFVILMGQNS